MLKRIENFTNLSIILSILVIITGIVLIVSPSESFTVISYMIASLLTIKGILLFIDEVRYGSPFVGNILYATMSFIFGLILLFHPLAFKVIIPLVLGIWFIINASLKFGLALSFKDNTASFIMSIIMFVLAITAGGFLIANPIKSADMIIVALGITLIIYSITDIINMFLFKKGVKEIVKSLENKYKEITW